MSEENGRWCGRGGRLRVCPIRFRSEKVPLGWEIAQHARIYIWPLAQHAPTADGRRGSLHAKIALADGRVMLISSANLTEYAMTLNMEMGVLLRGGTLPQQVELHLKQLVEQGIFELV